MSWWDSASFSNFASNALKTAQQRIDKVLDIKDDEDDGAGETVTGAVPVPVPNESSPTEKDVLDTGDGSFWASYLGPSNSLTGFTSTPSQSKSVSKPTARTPAVASTGSEFSLSSGGSEHSELKTSATSAFTVRSKRIESTVTKSQVTTTKVESEQVLSEAVSRNIELKTECSKIAAEKTDTHSTATEPALTQNLPLSVKDKPEKTIEITKDDDSGSSPSYSGEDKKQEGIGKGGPLHLGSKKTKVKDDEAEKRTMEKDAKHEESTISVHVEQMLSVEDPTMSAGELSQAQRMVVCSTDDQNNAVSEGGDTDRKPTEWSTALEPTSDIGQSAEGNGWEEEDLDIDDVSEDREKSGSPPVENQEDKLNGVLSEEVIEEVTISADITGDVTGEVRADLTVTKEPAVVSQDEISEVDPQSSPPLVSNPEKLSEQSNMEESNQSVEVIDASELCVSEMDMNVQECVEKTEDTESSTTGDAAYESETPSMVVVDTKTFEAETPSMILVEDTHTREAEVELKSSMEVVDGADAQVSEVSFDSSDATDAAGDDQLSESSRTLTGDDFHSLQEEAEQQPDGEPAIMPAAEDSPANVPPECKEEKKAGPLVSSSYVKTMLEEAMTESVKDTDSHSSSTSDKSSEMVRIESGMNSGHTSGDEIDTTTSSDIEIISTPTPNGEYRQERPFDLSPLRHALSRTMRRGSPPGHKRSDSSSSGQSTWSKNGDDLLSPDGGAHRDMDSGHDIKRDEHRKGQSLEGHQCLKETSEEGGTSNNPLETQTLLKDDDDDDESAEQEAPTTTTTSQQLDVGLTSLLHTIVERAEPGESSSGGVTTVATSSSHPAIPVVQGLGLGSEPAPHPRTEEPEEGDIPSRLNEKLAEMAEVLEAREKKLVELSRENIDLHEAKAILKNQLQQSEEAREAELEDLNTVTEEFTGRISDFEQKLHSLARERDALRKELNEAQNELSKKTSSSSGMERLLREKDQQVAELLDEGEKLSKQQLTSNNIIKKLRVKEKDNDALIKTHKQKTEQQGEELSHLRMVLDAKEDLEKRQIEAIGLQNAAVKKQESDLLMLKGELEDMQEKARGLQAALDNSYKEISELHKANAGAASETARAKLSVEMSAKQELQMAMERQMLTHKQQIDSLLAQIEDLQLSMVRQEREQGRREDVLRQEIADIQQRLQEAEERNQDLTQILTSATRPLLRQIKNLQSTYDAQSGSYEKVETNLTQRLNESQMSLAEAVEKERAASEHLMDVTSRLTSVETQVSTLRQEKSHLQAQLEVEKTKVMVLEDSKNTDSAQLEVLKTKFIKEISELKKEKVMLENQCEMEKMRVESERKKVMLAHEQLRDKELQLQRQGMTPSPRATTPRSMISVSEEVVHEASPMTASITQEDILEKTLLLGSTNGSRSNLYDTLRHTGAATLMENLQSQLKMKEGEIVQLQNEIGELERTREAMARELVNLSTANDVLQEQVEEYPELKKAHGELDSRYNALLQMYGEKVEEADELSMDLQDVKDMYKAQIEELVKRVR